MLLTEHEKRMLAGEYGYAARKSLEVLCSLGESYGAERMAPQVVHNKFRRSACLNMLS